MSEFKPPAEIAVHVEGGHLVPDQPIDLPEGSAFKVIVVEQPSLTKNPVAYRRLEGFAGAGKNLPRLEDKYIDDRETYYEGRY